MRAVGYLRVSTQEQADSGYGLEAQRLAILRFCADLGFVLHAVYTDAGVSGAAGLDERPALSRALAELEAGRADRLVVYRLDRLARDLILQELLLARLAKAGTPVLSVTEPDIDTLSDDPTKTLIRQVLGALAQYERALIRGRMDAGRAVKAAAGGYVGGQPRYGTKAAAGDLTHNEEEAVVVERVLALRSQGRSYRQIASELEAAGLRPRRAARWHPMVVRAIAIR
jgi:DNA invertase Pin-like site-specific DNA recombinase